MAHSSCIELNRAEQQQLLQLARRSLREGLHHGSPPPIDLQQLPESLAGKSGVFVTLTHGDRLRGCIGSMVASDPLANAVTESAYNAAFGDPRFPPLQQDELEKVVIEISVLSDMKPVPALTREGLLAALRPGQDGLLVQENQHRATYLPQVWSQLPDPEKFLDQLFLKAGLPAGYWSASLKFFCYQTLSFSEAPQDSQ